MDELLASFSVPPNEIFTAIPAPPARFYGVQIPGKTEEKPTVLHKLPAPKNFLAVIPTARFKEFSTYEDAALFSQFKIDVPTDQNFKRAAEPRSPYPSPSNQDKELLMSAVANGDIFTVRRLAWKNPRLLVTADDVPQCYRGTWRQTMLHLAVQSESFSIFCTLMEIIENPTFATATQLTDYEDVAERSMVIVSNFLNNRTKKEESVLDYAVMHGMAEVVDFLTVHPLCDLVTSQRCIRQGSASNRPADPAKALVGTKCGSERRHHVENILSFLNGRWYVPVFSPAESFQRATIGEPCKVQDMWGALRKGVVAAFFGPTTEGRCREFYENVQKLRRPHQSLSTSPVPFTEKKNGLSAIHRTAGGVVPKRTELLCRTVAHEMKESWKEWWGFLGVYANISSRDGLMKLEKYLAEHFTAPNIIKPAESSWHPPSVTCRLKVVEILSLYYRLPRAPASKNLPLPVISSDTEDSSDEIFYTPPSSPESAGTTLRTFCFKYSARSNRFIGGGQPIYADYSVYEALKEVCVPDDFRYIVTWKSLMETHLRSAELVESLNRLSL